jgi:ERCC4-type nuclease
VTDRPTILVDTRENVPWTFSRDVVVERRKLDAGDYTTADLVGVVAIERKSADDFVDTLARGRERFMREVRTLANMRAAWVIVEADLHRMLRGEYRGNLAQASLLGSVASLTVDWGVPVLFGGNRAASAILAERLLVRARRRWSSDPIPPPPMVAPPPPPPPAPPGLRRAR